jgi:hypothetical protein
MRSSVPGVPRWALICAHGVALVVLPSGIWRILALVADVPLLDRTSEGHPELEVFSGPVYLVLLTVVTELLAYLTVGLVAPWGETVPRWTPWLGGRRIPVGAAVVPAGIGAAVLTLLWTYSLVMVAAGRTVDGGTDVGLRLHSWQYLVFWLSYGPLVLWGPLLGAVTVHYYRRRSLPRPLPEPGHAGAPGAGAR